MDPLVARTAEAITRHDLLPDGARVLLGLSGGIDSVALLEVLRRLAPAHGWTLQAAYVNHGLRPEADREARELEAFCRGLGVPYATRKGAIPREGHSPEEAARALRYALLNALAAEVGATHLALAHHADDQLETVLFRWVQGAGAAGLSGMRPIREQAKGPRIVRPFLEIPRAEIAGYHARHGLPCWEDASNRDEAVPRNRLRQRVVPELKRLNPSLLEGLPLRLGVLAEESDWIARHAREAEGALRRAVDVGLVAWDHGGFMRLDRVLRRRIVHGAFREVGGDVRRLTARGVERVLDRWEAAESGALDLGGGVRAVLHAGWVGLDRDPAPGEALPLHPGETVRVPGGSVSVSVGPAEGGWGDPDRVVFGLEALPGDWVLRRADPAGDRFQPWGHGRERSLNRFLAKERVFEPLRRRLWVVARGSEVLWVVGMQRTSNFPVTQAEKTAITVAWAREARFDNPPSGTYHEG